MLKIATHFTPAKSGYDESTLIEGGLMIVVRDIFRIKFGGCLEDLNGFFVIAVLLNQVTIIDNGVSGLSRRRSSLQNSSSGNPT